MLVDNQDPRIVSFGELYIANDSGAKNTADIPKPRMSSRLARQQQYSKYACFRHHSEINDKKKNNDNDKKNIDSDKKTSESWL